MPLAAESSQLLIVDITLRTLLRAVGRGRHFESKIIRFVFLFMSIFRRQDESRAGGGVGGAGGASSTMFSLFWDLW